MLSVPFNRILGDLWVCDGGIFRVCGDTDHHHHHQNKKNNNTIKIPATDEHDSIATITQDNNNTGPGIAGDVAVIVLVLVLTTVRLPVPDGAVL